MRFISTLLRLVASMIHVKLILISVFIEYESKSSVIKSGCILLQMTSFTLPIVRNQVKYWGCKRVLFSKSTVYYSKTSVIPNPDNSKSPLIRIILNVPNQPHRHQC